MTYRFPSCLTLRIRNLSIVNCTAGMDSEFRARLTKNFRGRGLRVRQVYHTWRRVERFFRDADRRRALGQLPPTTLRIPHERGFLVIPPGAFAESNNIVGEAKQVLSSFDVAAPPAGKNRKRFLQNVLDASSLTHDSAIIRFALRQDVLAAVSEYLRIVPFLTSIQVFHSDTVDDVPTSSQLYHCDGDDVTQVKVFIYCSDVNEESGPLTVLDADATAEVQRSTSYRYRQRLTDDEVERVLGARHHAILGPEGTTAFVDTSRCFHFGSRVGRDAPPRLAAMIQYQTPYSFMLPADVESVLPFRRLVTPGMTALQRLVLGE
jgi:hypothetical protein